MSTDARTRIWTKAGAGTSKSHRSSRSGANSPKTWPSRSGWLVRRAEERGEKPVAMASAASTVWSSASTSNALHSANSAGLSSASAGSSSTAASSALSSGRARSHFSNTPLRKWPRISVVKWLRSSSPVATFLPPMGRSNLMVFKVLVPKAQQSQRGAYRIMGVNPCEAPIRRVNCVPLQVSDPPQPQPRPAGSPAKPESSRATARRTLRLRTGPRCRCPRRGRFGRSRRPRGPSDPSRVP